MSHDPAPTPPPAAIYCRVSRDRTGAGLAVERQESDCRDLADRLGLTVAQVFVDNDISAYSGKRRPGYEAMLAAVESGAVGVILAWHNDRLHRSLLELERFIDLSERYGVLTHTVTAGAFDLATPAGRWMARQLAAAARYESEHRSERIKAARVQQAKDGKHHGGQRPYGYDKHGMVPDPVEAAEVVKMVESVRNRMSLRSIVRDLNERGVPTSTGKRWRSQSLRDLVNSPRIAGLSVHHGEIVGEAAWPALVPRESWEAARAVLADPNRRTNPGGGATPKHLGSGVYICGVCGERKLTVGRPGGRQRPPAYRCTNRDSSVTSGHVSRRADQLDDYVEAVMVERLSRPRLVDSAKRCDDTAEAASLRAEQDVIRQRLEQLAESYGDGEIDRTQLATATKRLKARAETITQKLASIGGRSPLDIIPEDAVDVPALWQSLTLGQRRAIVDYLADVEIVPLGRGVKGFSPDGVRITWKR